MYLSCKNCGSKLTESLYPASWQYTIEYLETYDGTEFYKDRKYFIPRGAFVHNKAYSFSWRPEDSGIPDLHYKIRRPSEFCIAGESLVKGALPEWHGRGGCCDWSGHTFPCPFCGEKEVFTANLDCHQMKHVSFMESKVKRVYK